ncbi:MAG: hypothetical protein NQU42_01835 [Methanothrix sp.]|uniref:hypothetical protein n=1 Tax=Methanothrix sp. TaxID=90426 RepID=UPI0025CD5B3E|nr:hypothetical protein [Methanothrix sp.]MCQ8902828.1 hypothetical protein [Methanothrix sp.]
MDDLVLSYQMLIKAVGNATGASSSIYPNDYSYIAIPMRAVRAVLSAFRPEPHGSDPSGDISARRLWYMFREYNPRCACSLIRLSSPRSMDIVGVVTEEDVSYALPSRRLGNEIMRVDRMLDDIAENAGNLWSIDISASGASEKGRAEALEEDGGIEMTLIEPLTKQIFKRSWGGTFGMEDWPVSSIKAFAVWF